MEAGLIITGFFEDDFVGNRLLDENIKIFCENRAVKKKL